MTPSSHILQNAWHHAPELTHGVMSKNACLAVRKTTDECCFPLIIKLKGHFQECLIDSLNMTISSKTCIDREAHNCESSTTSESRPVQSDLYIHTSRGIWELASIVKDLHWLSLHLWHVGSECASLFLVHYVTCAVRLLLSFAMPWKFSIFSRISISCICRCGKEPFFACSKSFTCWLLILWNKGSSLFKSTF